MNSNTKKLVFLVIILAVIAVLLNGIFGLSSPLLRLLGPGSGKELTQTLKKDFTEIDIDSKISNIRIYESRENTGRVEWNGSGSTILRIDTNRGKLNIRERHKLFRFLFSGIGGPRPEIRVWLPKKSYEMLSLKSNTGNIAVPAGFTFGNADIGTNTGSIEFRSDVRGELKAESDTGRITLSGQHCKELDAESDTGSISLTNVRAAGNMKIRTDTGRITLERCDAESLDLESDTGSVTASLLSEKIFSAKSDVGRISIPESGHGGPCSVRTDTGSITMTIVR